MFNDSNIVFTVIQYDTGYNGKLTALYMILVASYTRPVK